MSIKELDYYLVDADITLRSDHLPLKKFLAKNTLNSKVNNWAVEISPFKITFEYITGIKNTLADTMSCLVDIDPDTTQPEEELGFEFGYYIFDSLLPISVEEVCTIDLLPSIKITDPDNETHLLLDPMDPGGDANGFLELLNHEHYEIVSSLQDQDTFCHQILTVLRHGKLVDKHMYTIQKAILKKNHDD